MDIRQLLVDNAIRDIMAEEDRKIIATLRALVENREPMPSPEDMFASKRDFLA